MKKGPATLAPDHLRFHRRQPSAGVMHCLVLDCSGSMLKGRNLSLAKGLLMHWSGRIYQERGQMAVIGFSGEGAKVLQSPTRAGPRNEQWIRPIAGGGGTPVAAGLRLAEQLVTRARRGKPLTVVLWLLSDGRFDPLPLRPGFADTVGLVDFESTRVRLGRMPRLANAWDAPCWSIDQLIGR